MTGTLVIVGAGVCGGAAVQTLRNEGFDGRIVLAGDEPHLPYERPPLSKEYLQGKQERDALPLLDDSWYEDQAVEAKLGVRVASIDARDRTVRLEGGEEIKADAVLLATGGRPRKLDVDPSERILYLRTVEDSDRIRARLGSDAKLVVVGAGFIGAEVAASARTLGTEVTVIEMFAVPLMRALGEEMGRVYEAIHRDHGIDLRLGSGVESIKETADGVVVRNDRGELVEGEAAVVGIAIAPNIDLAEAAGLKTENGIVVDEYCQTSAEGIYAAGDVANHFHPIFGQRMRVEHFDNALKQGAAAARNMLGRQEVYDDPHWFWSDQYDHNLQYAGFAAEWDEIVVRGSIDERNFTAFYLKEGLLLATLGLNRGRDVRRAMKLISARIRPDPEALRDEDVDLRTLLTKAG
ncbi:MAG: NAD(P)/FAD-dependent oxidoreductase [Actinomycetota bacterium]